MKTELDLIRTIVDRINTNGCRVTLPYREPSPIVVLFDGDFNSAAYIKVYPSTLYIIGMCGQIAVSDIADVEQISRDEYVIVYGRESHFSDLMIKISE